MASYAEGLHSWRQSDKEHLSQMENLSKFNDSLMKQVESAKKELNNHFMFYHDMLNDKHQQMISELDDILSSANNLYRKRNELIQTQKELEEKIRSNEFHDMKSKMLDLLIVEMSELENSISCSEREVVELGWKDSQLEVAIKESCTVSERDPVIVSTPAANTTIMYKDMHTSVWSVGSVGDRDEQMMEPKGLAFDFEDEKIYVADRDNNRIIVFNKNGVPQRNLVCDGMVKPWTVLILDEYCFIPCIAGKEGLILKVNKKTGEVLAVLKSSRIVVALTLDKETNLLFCCPYNIASIWQIEQEDLKKDSELKLETPNFTQGTTQIYSLETRKEEIFVLFWKSPCPLQSFFRDGQLLKNMIIPAGMIKGAQFFTIDSRCNFILSDNLDQKVKVFSNAGELIAVIGKDMTAESGQGELYSPRGIALTGNGNIVVCDGKPKNILQMF